MAAALKSQARLGAASRRAVTVRASAEPSVSRRAALASVLGGLAALTAADKALAVKIPSQNFTGGMVVGGGAIPKSSTLASAEGYALDTGIKHPSALSAKKRKQILAEVRKNAGISS